MDRIRSMVIRLVFRHLTDQGPNDDRLSDWCSQFSITCRNATNKDFLTSTYLHKKNVLNVSVKTNTGLTDCDTTPVLFQA